MCSTTYWIIAEPNIQRSEEKAAIVGGGQYISPVCRYFRLSHKTISSQKCPLPHQIRKYIIFSGLCLLWHSMEAERKDQLTLCGHNFCPKNVIFNKTWRGHNEFRKLNGGEENEITEERHQVQQTVFLFLLLCCLSLQEDVQITIFAIWRQH